MQTWPQEEDTRKLYDHHFQIGCNSIWGSQEEVFCTATSQKNWWYFFSLFDSVLLRFWPRFPQILSCKFNSCCPKILSKYHPRCKASDGNLKPKDIEALWKASSERQAILAGMPESEIKRRRYWDDKHVGTDGSRYQFLIPFQERFL